MEHYDPEEYERDVRLAQEMKVKTDAELYEVITHREPDAKYAASSHLTTRGGRANFLKALEFCTDPDPSIRVQGAFILGQLGTPGRPFSEESAPVLIGLLQHDPDEDVRSAAAFALGHLENPLALPHLVASARDPSAEIRYGAAFSLPRFQAPEVVEPLIALSADADDDVRNWATFALGSLLDFDTAVIRDALAARLTEDEAEIRGEALIGLAKRRDERVVEPLQRELAGEFFGSWCLEAAELYADARFYPHLVSLRGRMAGEEQRFIDDLERALAACRPATEGA